MDSWQVIRIQEDFSRPFIDRLIKDRNIFEENKNYKLALVYGKAGNFKSSTINMYLRSDSLQSGVNSDGVTKGIYLCKKGGFIIADTEGTGTDNNQLQRHDIVSLFCVCSSFIIVSAIYNRFPISDITDMIDEKLAVLQKMYKSSANDINKPLLIILCPIGRNMNPDRIKSFRNDAEKYKRDNIPSEIRVYFSDVVIKVLSPLPAKVREIIDEREEFRVQDLAGNEILNEVDEVFDIAFNQNQHSKSGKCFHLLNEYFNLAQSNKIINPLMLEKATEFIQAKLQNISRVATICECDYDAYVNSLQNLKVSVINEINRLSIDPEYILYYKTKFEEEFEKWSQNHGDIFNESLKSLILKIFNNEINKIVEEVQSNLNLTYQSFQSMVNSSKQRLNEIKIVKIANNKEKISDIISLIKSKVSELDNSDLKNVFIRFAVCKNVQDNYFNQIKEALKIVKIAERNEAINKHKAILGERLEIAIKKHYATIGQPSEDKSAFKSECMVNFFRNSCEFYDSNFKSNHERCLNILEEERKMIQNQVNEIIQNVGSYNSKIVDRFSDRSKSADIRFLNNLGKDLYNAYADDFYNTVIISQYDLISSNAARSCIYSTSYYQCPDCGNIWEKRIEVGIDQYIGCGNFYCYGKGIGCNGRQFRTEMKQANLNNKLAKQLDVNEVMNLCNNEINTMKNGALHHLRQSLVKKH